MSQHAAADRREFVGQIDHRLEKTIAANRQTPREAADPLRPISTERADSRPNSRTDGKLRIEAHRIQTESHIAAGIDQREERAITEIDRDQRRLATVVEGDRRAWQQRGIFRRLQQDATSGIIECQQCFPEQRESQDSIDPHPQVGGKGLTIVKKNRHILETHVPQLQPAQGALGQLRDAAVRARHAHPRRRAHDPASSRITPGQSRRHEGHR